MADVRDGTTSAEDLQEGDEPISSEQHRAPKNEGGEYYDAVEHLESYSYLNTNPAMVLKSWLGLDSEQFLYARQLGNAHRYADLKYYIPGKEYLYDARLNRGMRVATQYRNNQEHEELFSCCLWLFWPCHNCLWRLLPFSAFLLLFLIVLGIVDATCGAKNGPVEVTESGTRVVHNASRLLISHLAEKTFQVVGLGQGKLGAVGSTILLALLGTFGWYCHDSELQKMKYSGRGRSDGDAARNRQGRIEAAGHLLVGAGVKAGGAAARPSDKVDQFAATMKQFGRATQYRTRDVGRDSVAVLAPPSTTSSQSPAAGGASAVVVLSGGAAGDQPSSQASVGRQPQTTSAAALWSGARGLLGPSGVTLRAGVTRAGLGSQALGPQAGGEQVPRAASAALSSGTSSKESSVPGLQKEQKRGRVKRALLAAAKNLKKELGITSKDKEKEKNTPSGRAVSTTPAGGGAASLDIKNERRVVASQTQAQRAPSALVVPSRPPAPMTLADRHDRTGGADDEVRLHATRTPSRFPSEQKQIEAQRPTSTSANPVGTGAAAFRSRRASSPSASGTGSSSLPGAAETGGRRNRPSQTAIANWKNVLNDRPSL